MRNLRSGYRALVLFRRAFISLAAEAKDGTALSSSQRWDAHKRRLVTSTDFSDLGVYRDLSEKTSSLSTFHS